MVNFYLPDFIRCPICGESMTREGGSLYCGGERRHTFDIAKEGYVNLLPPGRAKNARTGDGADMIRAREKFLCGGGYDRYSREAAEFAADFLDVHEASSAVLIDAGCGEGRHTVNMSRAIADRLGVTVTAAGFDASKYGVQTAAKRYVKNGPVPSVGDTEDKTFSLKTLFAAANIFSLPVIDGCASVFTSLFAPLPDGEARRVLRGGGLLLICAAGPGHLCEMREILYDTPIPSGGGAVVPDGFETVGEKMIEYSLELSSGEEITSLFTMTPFYHNAPHKGRERLEARESLTVTVQVRCTVARKN